MEHAFEKKFPVNAKDYKLYEEVGEGVSATVFRALCVPLNEIVAIKVLDLEKCSNDLDGVRREVQTMSLIDHSNVLRAHCSFTTAHNLWVVMPYMAGGSCLHIMKSAYPEGFEEFIIAILLREVLKALAYLHSHGHIHRDVKAGNILLDCDGAVKLGDFGVSACMFDTGDRQRSRNTFVGTPCWMAPEVMQQLHGYDFKADIWSFGITALELAHGHAPFSKYPPMKVLLMTLQNAPPGLDYERDKRFSKSFKEMVAACLVKDPKKRPASEKLLKHHFFKHARSHEFLSHTILDGLPPLGDRFRMLKVKEADLLIQNKALYGDKEQLSQQEYIRGISAWNFNTEDLKNQAALIQEPDEIIISNFNGAEIQVEENNNNNSLLSFPSPPLQALKGCFDVVEDDVVTTGTTPSAHHRVRADVPEKLMNGSDGSSARAVPRHVIPSPKKFFSGTFVPDNHPSPRKASIEGEQRSFSGPLASRQWRDSINTNTPGTGVAEETSPDRGKVQRRGRFKVTSSDVVAAKVQANSHAPLLPDSLLPALQGLLQQNAFQREELLRLIKQVEQNSGVPDVSAAELSSSRERELHSQLIHLQRSIGTLLEEVQQQKTHNSLLEQRLNTLSKDNGR